MNPYRLIAQSSGWLCASILVATMGAAHAADTDETQIRKALGGRIAQMSQIDEIQPTSMPGLYEIRIGTNIFYSDAKGDYLIQGELIDTRARRNITEDRIRQLTAIDFSKLPMAGAFTIVKGNGQRKIAVFEDPNCGYCKRFERDLHTLDNITVHVFLYPILSPDSVEKSRNIWCSKDKIATWMNVMLRDKTAPAATCNIDGLRGNLEFGNRQKITGTPTIIFSNGQRISSALNAEQLEQRLADAEAKPATSPSKAP